MLTWRGEDQRIGYANMDKLAPTNLVGRGTQTSPLPDAHGDFSTFRYTVRGITHDLDHFMTRLNVVGLLVITDGQCDRVRINREHAWLIPAGARLPLTPRGPVFRIS